MLPVAPHDVCTAPSGPTVASQRPKSADEHFHEPPAGAQPTSDSVWYFASAVARTPRIVTR